MPKPDTTSVRTLTPDQARIEVAELLDEARTAKRNCNWPQVTALAALAQVLTALYL